MPVKFSFITTIAIIMFLITVTPARAEELIEAQGRVLTKEDFVAPVIEKTENKNRNEQIRLFEDNLYKLMKIDPDKVLFMCIEQQYGYGKYFGINTDNGWTCDFILGKNDRFKGPLDNHGSVEYQLINIGEDSVTLRYQSEFNHMSFGQQKVTVDEGTVELNYR